MNVEGESPSVEAGSLARFSTQAGKRVTLAFSLTLPLPSMILKWYVFSRLYLNLVARNGKKRKTNCSHFLPVFIFHFQEGQPTAFAFYPRMVGPHS